MAHDIGAQIFVDAVHYAPHELIDVRDWNCDFLACSAYKFYGPHIGILYGRRDLLDSLDFPKLIPAPDSAPERAETGTQNHEGIAGAAAAVDFLASLAPGPLCADAWMPRSAASRTRRCLNHTTVEWLAGNRACPPLRVAARRSTHADDCIHYRRRPIDRGGEEFGGTRSFPIPRRLLRYDNRRAIGPAPHGCSRRLCLLHHSGRSGSVARCSTRAISQVTSVPTTTTLMNGRAERRARATPHYIEQAINEYDRNSGKPVAFLSKVCAERSWANCSPATEECMAIAFLLLKAQRAQRVSRFSPDAINVG